MNDFDNKFNKNFDKDSESEQKEVSIDKTFPITTETVTVHYDPSSRTFIFNNNTKLSEIELLVSGVYMPFDCVSSMINTGYKQLNIPPYNNLEANAYPNDPYDPNDPMYRDSNIKTNYTTTIRHDTGLVPSLGEKMRNIMEPASVATVAYNRSIARFSAEQLGQYSKSIIKYCKYFLILLFIVFLSLLTLAILN